ncbi:sensor histidine kinase [Methanococcoides burtonii]|uniref:histidine kinase n=1 Tax=Methanococcoides burtonii (strain DSM 6242 / NBRC 107633 / OCM 468 / ACE-M) TaxID=259564 RepID=Q12YI4_METBU|nr:sensor histidine kinase [Methanococcoides burtonii]ABE51492.1 HATPase domain-containing external sensor signal transduction histidine kinase [Methanococcoides burtonii DSM 6242]
MDEVPLKIKLIIYIGLSVLLVMAATTAIIISTSTSQHEDLAYKKSIEKASNYANKFNSDMQSNMAMARTIASTLTVYNSSDREEVNDILKEILIDNPNLIGTYTAFEPNAFDGKDAEYAGTEGYDSTGRLVPYWNKIGGTIFMEPLLYYEISDYYQLPKQLEQEVLTESYLYQGELIVSYVSPIIRDGEFIGIGGVDVSLNYIDEIVSNVTAFETGYAFTTSNTGMLLSHPVHKDWIGKKTLNDLNDSEITFMADNIRVGQGGHIETVDPTTGEDVIIFYEPVRTGNYSFILVIPKEDMLADVRALRNELILISSIALIFMAGAAYLVAISITRPINEIISNFEDISKSALKGDLNRRAEADVGVDFRKIPSGLNDILDSLQIYSNDLEKANKELKSLDQMKDVFLSNVSHELRTPLTSIKGYTQNLYDESLGDINGSQKTSLETVLRNADRLRRLVDSLLYISQAQAEIIEYDFKECYIAKIISNTIMDTIMLVEENDLHIEKKIPSDLPTIEADEARLVDMLNNIVDNAIKFTPPGGMIILGVFDDENYLHLTVSDTGIGIPKELIPNLFKKFYQIDSSIRRKYGGTGLGLYICKKIVDAHSGEIWIESEPHKGTTVHIRLPKVRDGEEVG